MCVYNLSQQGMEMEPNGEELTALRVGNSILKAVFQRQMRLCVCRSVCFQTVESDRRTREHIFNVEAKQNVELHFVP